ncbi:hypothetical protein VTN49DRAFT_1731 [Thermomyces lanuginosus]|uniref:uncharacterized protein n=1 Tax=Thermomyces lanuginosus TaxID=5541 RepID=UPI0037424DBC
MEPLSQEELQRFQELSNEYEPDIKGPLVSVKQSSQIISAEYANADPTYVTKTSALAVTHPFTRIMKGDGNCGWRAVAFGYFENLFYLRDVLKVQQELARIKSLSQLLQQVGQQEHLYEIFVDATEEVFNQIIQSIQQGVPDESFLVDAFNAEYNSNAIITHFRLLTSAWIKLNPHRYQAYLPMPIDQYCATRVETVKSEIDEVGLQALVHGVIQDSGMAVEILYLDRSQGDRVTPHMLTPDRAAISTIRLLYRPGHYDLLYTAPPPPPVNVNPVVNYQYGMMTNYAFFDQAAPSFDVNPQLMSIPNLMLDPTYPTVSNTVMPSAPSYISLPPAPRPYYSPPVSPPSQTTVASPPPSSLPLSPPKSNDDPFRWNALAMKPELRQTHLTSAPFQNSEYNTAHFKNPGFEPVQYAFDNKSK